MLRTHRVLTLITAALALTGAAGAPSATTSAEPQMDAVSPLPSSPSMEPTTEARSAEPSGYLKPCADTKLPGSSDLCAQWTAANAARDAADWAWWQLWLSASGVIGLGATLWFNFRALRIAEKESAETKSALAIAQRNADAAVRATEAMDRQAKLMADAQRPWLDFEIDVTGVPSYGPTEEQKNQLSVTFKLRNHSDWPAHTVLASGSGFYGTGLLAVVGTKGDREAVKQYLDDPRRRQHGTVVFPREPAEILSFITILDPDEFMDRPDIGATLTMMVRYSFEGGVGYTEKVYVMVGVRRFIDAALRGDDPGELRLVPIAPSTRAY